MTYYLKYRPQKLEDLDLRQVRESLKKVVASGKVPHALLFSGPKGSGKTSAARILAKIVNCESTSSKLRGPGRIEPCNKCKQCTSVTSGSNIDVIEIDAASHRGINDVRTLRDAVKLAPAGAKKKVYVIDEAHMLTTEASNALLKTLEEPPYHVMFILATTNPEKLLETIRSRAVGVEFKKATVEELVRSLGKVVKGEKIKADKKILELIAKSSDGSFRDATKILEQLVIEKVPLKAERVEEFLFQRRAVDLEKFLSLLSKRDTKGALVEVERIVELGTSMQRFLESVVSRLRSALLAKVGVEGDDLEVFSKDELVLLIKLMSKAVEQLPNAVLEQIPVELAIVEWCEKKFKDKDSRRRQSDYGASATKIKNFSNSAPTASKKATVSDNEKPLTQGGQDRPQNKSVQSVSKSMKSVTKELWAKILSEIKPKNTSTEALLRAARPIGYDGDTLTLGVFYRFHKEKLETAFHRRLLEDVVGGVLGNSVRVVCTLTEHSRINERKGAEDGPPDEVPYSSEDFDLASSADVLTESNSVLTDAEDEDIIKVAKEIFGS